MVKDSVAFKDPYLDEASGCLRNKLNIADEKKLSRLETILSSLRMTELVHQPLQKKFDLAHLQATHKYIFQDIYDWAGEIRTVDMMKDSTYFAPHFTINRSSKDLFNQLAREKHLQGLNAEDFSDYAGHFLGEINYLHPFRDGNGRTQRSFMNQLAAKNHYFITWDKVSPEQMVKASIQADEGDHELLANIIQDNLIDRDYTLALEKYGRHKLTEMTPAELGQTYRGPVIGLTKRYVVQELQDKPHQLVIHDRQTLMGDIKVSPKIVQISYPYGKIGLVYEEGKEIHREHDMSDYER